MLRQLNLVLSPSLTESAALLILAAGQCSLFDQFRLGPDAKEHLGRRIDNIFKMICDRIALACLRI